MPAGIGCLDGGKGLFGKHVPVTGIREALLKPAKLAIKCLAFVIRQNALEGAKRSADAANSHPRLVNRLRSPLRNRHLVHVKVLQCVVFYSIEGVGHGHLRIEGNL